MKINNVHILNWKAPGEEFWKEVEKRSSEPLIEAVITMTLSGEEYQKLLASDSRYSESRC